MADTVAMSVLSCPTDGTILEHGVHNCSDGLLACPRCQQRWEPYEVAQ